MDRLQAIPGAAARGTAPSFGAARCATPRAPIVAARRRRIRDDRAARVLLRARGRRRRDGAIADRRRKMAFSMHEDLTDTRTSACARYRRLAPRQAARGG